MPHFTPRASAHLAALLIAFALAPRMAGADGAADAEALARTVYIEGVPYAAARTLDEAGVARLIEMLGDEAEARQHAQIAELLGMSGRPGAYEAISAAAAEPPHGEVDAATLRKRVALLAALGHLARSDDRALSDLIAAAGDADSEPGWGYRHLRGRRLARLLRRSALTGLALSGRRQAASVLQQVANAPRGRPEDAAVAEHAAQALALHARVVQQGAESAFDPDASGGGRR